MRVPLPIVAAASTAQAHIYPIQIALQTQQMLQVSVFHAVFSGVAAGQRVRQENAIDEIEAQLVSDGMARQTLELGWTLMAEHSDTILAYTMQLAVISIRSNWDWYLRRTAEFVRFCSRNLQTPSLNSKQQRDFDRIDRAEIVRQLQILEVVTGVVLTPPQAQLDALVMMSHVRNLGLHNRWEVDDQYLISHPQSPFKLGEVRTVEPIELQTWANAFRDIVRVSGLAIAKLYAAAPPYP